MGFLSWISNIGRKVWNGIKGFGTKAYDFGKKIIHGVSDAAQWIDQKLGEIGNIPIIGDLANALRGSEYYIGLKNLIGGARTSFDTIGAIGGAIGGQIDQMINPPAGGQLPISPVSGGVPPALPITAPRPLPMPRPPVSARPPAGAGGQLAF